MKNKLFKEFPVSKVFDILSSNGIFHAVNIDIYNNKIKNSHPYIVRTSQNNGIRGYIVEDKKFLNPKNTISFAQDTAQIFYQSEDYFTGNKIKVFKLRNYEMNENIALFLIGCLNKAFRLFKWGSSYDSKVLAEVKMHLPVKKEYKPDFDILSSLLETGVGGGISMKKIDTSTWKEFPLSTLFNASNGDIDLQQKDINDKGEFVVSSGEQNNGIIGKTDIKAKVFSSNTITIDMFGNAFYRDFNYKMVTHARVFSLTPKFEMNEKIGLFFVSCLSSLKQLYSYSNMCNWNKIQDMKILLPAKEIEVPDFEYMENYIRELESERISELESYLLVTGLNDYILDEKDKEILKKDVKIGLFHINDLFKVRTVKTKLAKSDLSENGIYDVYSSDTSNNGIVGKSKNFEFEVTNTIPKFVIFGDHTRSFNIADKNFSVMDNVKVLEPICFSDEVLLYIITLWKKQIRNLGYARHWTIAKDCILPLPIKTENYSVNDIDFDYMEAYIKAQEKLCIKDVVSLKDKILEETKKILNS